MAPSSREQNEGEGRIVLEEEVMSRLLDVMTRRSSDIEQRSIDRDRPLEMETLTSEQVIKLAGYVNLLVHRHIRGKGWSQAPFLRNLASRISNDNTYGRAFQRTLEEGIFYHEAVGKDRPSDYRTPLTVFALEFAGLTDGSERGSLVEADEICRMIALGLGFEAIEDPSLMDKRAHIESSAVEATKHVQLWNRTNQNLMYRMQVANPAEENPRNFRFYTVELYWLPLHARISWQNRVNA